MTDQEVNLHELVKLPYGEAEKALRKAGKWDEDRGSELAEYKVQCLVHYRMCDVETVTVLAHDEDDAIERAYDKIYEDSDVEDIEVKRVTPL